LECFKLPEDSWSIEYYKPLKAASEKYIKENLDSEAVRTVIDCIKAEIDDYEKYSEYYGYTFYICKANEK